MGKQFGMTERERNFYEVNIEKPVNLFTKEGTTYSGDLIRYNRERREVTLTNYILRDYSKEDGSSEFIECPEEFELDTSLITGKTVTTREDRLGRIVKYNEDLIFETSERKRKLKELEKLKHL